jgi:Icc-related predicted phosphoesterase
MRIVFLSDTHSHLFGHIHDAYGIEKTTATTFVSGAVTSEDYQLVNDCGFFEI